MLAADGPDVRVAMAAVGAAVFLTAIGIGAGIGWVRRSAARRLWTRRAQHGESGQDNARLRRILLFAGLAALAAIGAAYAALEFQPAWFAMVTCYDLGVLCAWWVLVAVNGILVRRTKP